MPQDFIDKLSRAQHERVGPILRTLLNRLGVISTAVGLVFFAIEFHELFTHQLDRGDAFFVMALTPFAAMLIYLIASSNQQAQD
jgi:hypothetical protein